MRESNRNLPLLQGLLAIICLISPIWLISPEKQLPIHHTQQMLSSDNFAKENLHRWNFYLNTDMAPANSKKLTLTINKRLFLGLGRISANNLNHEIDLSVSTGYQIAPKLLIYLNSFYERDKEDSSARSLTSTTPEFVEKFGTVLGLMTKLGRSGKTQLRFEFGHYLNELTPYPNSNNLILGMATYFAW